MLFHMILFYFHYFFAVATPPWICTFMVFHPNWTKVRRILVFPKDSHVFNIKVYGRIDNKNSKQ